MKFLPTRNSTYLTPMRCASLPICWMILCCARNKIKTEIGELEINNIGSKLHDNNDYILHNDLRNSRRNQINDIIQEFNPPLLGYLDSYYNLSSISL